MSVSVSETSEGSSSRVTRCRSDGLLRHACIAARICAFHGTRSSLCVKWRVRDKVARMLNAIDLTCRNLDLRSQPMDQTVIAYHKGAGAWRVDVLIHRQHVQKKRSGI